MKSLPSPETEPPPISFAVLVVIADARNGSSVMRVARQQFFAASPETLAALPSELHLLIRAVADDAQKELNKFLMLLAQPEPPAAEPPPTSPIPTPCSPSPEDAPPPTPLTPVLAEDYLLPINLPLLGTLP